MKTNLVLLLLLAMPLWACAEAPTVDKSSIEIGDAWVRTAPSAEAGRLNGALFMAIKNRGNSADALLKIECDSAGMAQIHLTEVDANGVASMKELQAAGIEPVQDYAHEYIEASALAWFQQRLDNRDGAKSLVA